MTKKIAQKIDANTAQDIASLVVFKTQSIRRILHNNEWWFVVQDIVAALTDSANISQYIKKMRTRDKELSEGWGQFVTPLTVKTEGGPQKVNCANTESLFRIIQSIPSPKAEPFKRWLAKQEKIKNTSQLIANIIGTHQFYCESTGRKLYNKNGVMAWVTGINHKYLNTVIASHIKSDESIAEITKFFADKKLPWIWTVTPLCLPDNLETKLISKDFSLIATHPVLSYDLTASLPVCNKNLNIKEVENDTMFDDWGIPLDEGLGSTPDDSVDYINMTKCTPHGAGQPFHHYVLYHNNKPASCATLSVSKFGARIDNVATRTKYLRQGFGRAITLFAMEKAKELGHQMICLESSDEGLRLYLGMGFVEVYQNKVYAQRQFID